MNYLFVLIFFVSEIALAHGGYETLGNILVGLVGLGLVAVVVGLYHLVKWLISRWK